MVYATVEVTADGGKVPSLLELCEVEEQLHHQLHAVHEVLDPFEGNRQAVVTAWVDHVRITIESFPDICPGEIVDRNKLWGLWVGVVVCKSGT